MIKFKVIRYGHMRRAWHSSMVEEQMAVYHECVLEWDLKDAETGKPIPVENLDQLSRDQMDELTSAFWAEVSVPKANAAPSLSSSVES